MSQDENAGAQGPASFAALRRFVRPRTAAERCDFCSTELPTEHRHLIDPASRQLLCACGECIITVGTQEGLPYRLVPQRVRSLPGFRLTDAQWDDLLIPVGMAFFFNSSAEGRVMPFYPSPAGPTESLLSLESWEEVVRDNPILGGMEPDVEALLVNRLRGHQEYYLVPIDKCYELVGLIRLGWKGLSGGKEVWVEIAKFYDKLGEQSSVAGAAGA
ncbi:MAG: DUF5947 family protein [Chloroflexia bacterium]